MSLFRTVNVFQALFLTVEFEQGNVCWVHIGKKNTSEDKISYIMHYVVVFSV